MSVKVRIDDEAVKSLCGQLGIEYERNPENKDIRDEVIYCLSTNIAALERLAKSGTVSLYDLSANTLLPPLFRFRIFEHTSNTKPAYRKDYFYKDIGKLTADDRTHFGGTRSVGKKALAIFDILRELHLQTSGFKTSLTAGLSRGEQISLIGRIVEGVRVDHEAQRKLMAMFPPPAP